MNRTLLLLLPLCLLACSTGSKEDKESGAGGDANASAGTAGTSAEAGTDGGANAGGGAGGEVGTSGGTKGGTSDVTPPLFIKSSLTLIDHPTRGESAVFGSIEISENGSVPTSTVTLTVNGVQLSSSKERSIYLDSIIGGPDPTGISAEPGDSLTIVATTDGASATLVTPCPAEVVITSPVEGAVVTPNESFEVTWTGSPGDAIGIANTPVVKFLPYNADDNDFTLYFPTPKGSYQNLASDDRSASLTVPVNTVSGYDDFLLDLRAMGPGVSTDEGEGRCALSRRVHLTR
jgi:hypothetical protein